MMGTQSLEAILVHIEIWSLARSYTALPLFIYYYANRINVDSLTYHPVPDNIRSHKYC